MHYLHRLGQPNEFLQVACLVMSLPHLSSVMIHKLHCVQINHVSEDHETFFYPLGLRGLVTKGLNSFTEPRWLTLTSWYVSIPESILRWIEYTINIRGFTKWNPGSLSAWQKYFNVEVILISEFDFRKKNQYYKNMLKWSLFLISWIQK